MSLTTTVSFSAPERDVLMHALRFESWFIRERWPSFEPTADLIDALHSKLQASFNQAALFDRGVLTLHLSKTERKLAADCLHRLGTELSFFHGDTRGARKADGVRELLRAA